MPPLWRDARPPPGRTPAPRRRRVPALHVRRLGYQRRRDRGNAQGVARSPARAALAAHGLSRLGFVASTEQKELWGTETRKAVDNFPVSGEPIPPAVARWLGRIKAAAARVNADLDLLDADKAERIAVAGDRIANGELDD